MSDPTRAALFQPEPAGLSDEELLKIAEDSCMDRFEGERRYSDEIAIEEGYWEAWDHQLLHFARAVEAATLARAQRQPVPVSERLPGPEDCDAEGRCWCFTPRLVFEGQLIFHSRWILSVPMEADTHWLPAPALPLPVEVGHD